MKRFIALLVISAICGALAGAAAGFATSSFLPEITTPVTRIITTTTAQIPKMPTSTFALIPLEQRPAMSLLPPAFSKRGVSAVAALYRKPKGASLEERTLADDRLVAHAVALTSDGWFVTSAVAVEGLHLTDLTLWHNGTTYAIERGIVDHLDNTVFLKVAAANLSPSAFARIQDLQTGAEMWLENRSGELSPAVVVSLTDRITTETVLSETVSRRIVVGGTSLAGDRGGAAWDPNGSLVGIVESDAGERVRLIPGSAIATSFASLLATGEIRHAQLGVRTVDLANLRFDGARDGLPVSGALIRDDKKTGKLGVVRDLAAFKAKLKIGDVILRVDRDILDGSADLGEILAEYQPGATVTLRVLRGTVDSDVQVTLGHVVTSEALK